MSTTVTLELDDEAAALLAHLAGGDDLGEYVSGLIRSAAARAELGRFGDGGATPASAGAGQRDPPHQRTAGHARDRQRVTRGRLDSAARRLL